MKTLPRVREAIEAELYDTVDTSIEHTAGVLSRLVEYLEQIQEVAVEQDVQ